METVEAKNEGAASSVDSLSTVVQHEGANVSCASLSDLVHALSNLNGTQSSNLEGDFGMSMLQLPPTNEEVHGPEGKICSL